MQSHRRSACSKAEAVARAERVPIHGAGINDQARVGRAKRKRLARGCGHARDAGQGGADHLIAGNECRDDLCAIKCVETVGARIERNRYETRWFGIHLLETRASTLSRNRAYRTMRAVTIEGGLGNRVEKQLAEHCDSGVVAEGAAAETVVVDSWFHDCRIGMYVWGAGDITFRENAISEPREHAVVTDRVLDLEGNDLGGDTWLRPT